MDLFVYLFLAVAATGSVSRAEEFYTLTEVNLTTLVVDQDNRIIGGTPTTIESYPFTVQILLSNQLACGGSLVTRRHVLSSAHCFVDPNTNAILDPTLFQIRAGTATLNTGGSTHSVSAIIIHERYNIPIRDNDIAVVLLSSAVTLSTRVALATIPTATSVVPDNAYVAAVGWGVTNTATNQASSILNRVTVMKVNLGVCRMFYDELQQMTGLHFPVSDNMMCAGAPGLGGSDACQGDSGGPLIYRTAVVGVLSWGYGCGDARYPGVSARVSSYTTWINETVTRYNSGYNVGPSVTLLVLLSFACAILNKN